MISGLAHAGAVEIAQAIIALIGLMAASWQVWDSVKDAAVVGLRPIELGDEEGPRRRGRLIIVQNNLLSDLIRFLVLMVFVGLGLVSLFLPPPPEYGLGRYTPEQLERFQAFLRFVGLQPLLTRLGLIVATVLLTIDGVAARRARRAYRRTFDGGPEEEA